MSQFLELTPDKLQALNAQRRCNAELGWLALLFLPLQPAISTPNSEGVDGGSGVEITTIPLIK